MTALPQPGHEPPVAVTSGFLVPGGIEWLDFGDQVDRENLRTRPQPVCGPERHYFRNRLTADARTPLGNN